LAAEKLLARLVAVADNGAISLGPDIVVDGHRCGAVARVTTHIHNDHTRGLSTSLRRLALHIATPLTHDLLEAMGYRVDPSRRVDVSYGAKLRIGDAMLRLLPARHVPGSAQVVVDIDGLLLGYTGDFKLPGTEPIRGAEVLVVDATYGMPEWRRPWQDEVEYLLPDLVNDALMKGPVNIYAYNGKIEEVLLLLRSHGVDAPVVAPRRKYRMLRVLEKHGYRIGDVLPEGSAEALEAERGGWVIRFRSFSEWSRRRRLAGVNVKLTGWEFQAPYRWLNTRDLVVSFSDHADFDQLVRYVAEARPRLLVVDSARGGAAARVFAEYARRRLGLQAVAAP